MRNIFLGIVIAFVIVFGLRYCENQKDNREQLEASSALIQKEIKNVGKLIVTEGRYAKVYTYKSNKDVFLGLVPSKKSVLIIANVKANVAYDLRKIETEIDEENKIVNITNIPEPELSLNPDISYYDIREQHFNQFAAEDFNKIKNSITKEFREDIKNSELVTNAENRLISELQKIYILTNSMGWTLKYNAKVVQSESDFQNLKL